MKRLKVFLYEALSYYVRLERQRVFLDAKFTKLAGAKFEESPLGLSAYPYTILFQTSTLFAMGEGEYHK
jgi:hypothetical protein